MTLRERLRVAYVRLRTYAPWRSHIETHAERVIAMIERGELHGEMDAFTLVDGGAVHRLGEFVASVERSAADCHTWGPNRPAVWTPPLLRVLRPERLATILPGI